MNQKELNEFWGQREVKIWVVSLVGMGRNPKRDSLIVRAKTKQGAFDCARENSQTFRNKRCSGSARYADPVADLHCVEREIRNKS